MAAVDFPEGLLPNPYVPAGLPRKPDDAKKTGKGKGAFRTALGAALKGGEEEEAGTVSAFGPVGELREADLSRLLDEVHGAGDKLKENPTVDLVQAYKKAVRDFMHFVVEKSFSVEEKSSGGNILKRKKVL